MHSRIQVDDSGLVALSRVQARLSTLASRVDVIGAAAKGGLAHDSIPPIAAAASVSPSISPSCHARASPPQEVGGLVPPATPEWRVRTSSSLGVWSAPLTSPVRRRLLPHTPMSRSLPALTIGASDDWKRRREAAEAAADRLLEASVLAKAEAELAEAVHAQGRSRSEFHVGHVARARRKPIRTRPPAPPLEPAAESTCSGGGNALACGPSDSRGGARAHGASAALVACGSASGDERRVETTVGDAGGVMREASQGQQALEHVE